MPCAFARETAVRHFLFSSVIAVCAFTMAFVSGYLFGRAEDGVGGPVAGLLAPLTRVAPRPATADTVLSEQEQERFKVFWEAWRIVERDFYNRGTIDHQRMIYGATKGMVEAVGDPYTVYLTPTGREISDTDLRGSFDGIGVHVDLRDSRLTVVAPIEGSPAAEAGLRPGDVITQVDGQSLVNKTLNDLVLLIRGPRGTGVTLTIVRPSLPDPLVLTIVRAEIRLESVRARMLDQGVGYLRITNFSGNTGPESERLLQDLLAQQPNGVVVDLRSNPGGYLHSAVQVANHFLDEGVIVHQADGNGERQTYRADPGGVATGARVAVLMNKGTASASEILAAALRDNGRSVLIGEQTFGKGTVQNVHELSDGSGLRVTTAQWLTPAEQPIQGVGITPDIASAGPPDGQLDPDPQLEAAVRYLLGG